MLLGKQIIILKKSVNKTEFKVIFHLFLNKFLVDLNVFLEAGVYLFGYHAPDSLDLKQFISHWSSWLSNIP